MRQIEYYANDRRCSYTHTHTAVHIYAHKIRSHKNAYDLPLYFRYHLPAGIYHVPKPPLPLSSSGTNKQTNRHIHLGQEYRLFVA